jgi:hypothetical protein
VVACPYLGLPDDARTRFVFATPAHRCYAKRRPASISLSHQGSFCLSKDFSTCERFPEGVSLRSARSDRHSAAGRAETAIPDTEPGQPPGDHPYRRTPVINVGPRPLPKPPAREEVAAPASTPKRRWGFVLSAVLLLALLAAIVLVVAIVGMSGVQAASTYR